MTKLILMGTLGLSAARLRLTTPGGSAWDFEIGGGFRLDRDYPLSSPYGYSDR